jgi:hypothetical protein
MPKKLFLKKYGINFTFRSFSGREYSPARKRGKTLLPK